MSRNVRISIGLVAAVVATVAVAALLTRDDDDGATVAADAPQDRQELLVRADSPRLTDGDQAEFVEFLDFECEACAALHPTIQELKTTYGDRVAFVVRYMPLHVSSMNAALAAEAAGAQGNYVEMHDLLFERQDEWGHQQTPERDLFFTYAADLGLDMDQFEADFTDPETAARIEQSEADGRALGVEGTPTMFMDGEQLRPESIDDLVAAFDAAVNDR